MAKLQDDVERCNFRQKRFKFVTDTLQEFDNLDASALDIIYNYKVDQENMEWIVLLQQQYPYVYYSATI